jgi:hypothetical protein
MLINTYAAVANGTLCSAVTAMTITIIVTRNVRVFENIRVGLSCDQHVAVHSHGRGITLPPMVSDRSIACHWFRPNIIQNYWKRSHGFAFRERNVLRNVIVVRGARTSPSVPSISAAAVLTKPTRAIKIIIKISLSCSFRSRCGDSPQPWYSDV